MILQDENERKAKLTGNRSTGTRGWEIPKLFNEKRKGSIHKKWGRVSNPPL
jgi:hypothetical protein